MDSLRLLLFNTHRTGSKRLDAMLARGADPGGEWDVAVLLEVSHKALGRLNQPSNDWQCSTSASRCAGPYPIAILRRGSGLMDPVPVDPFTEIDGRCYDERIHAVEIEWEGAPIIIVGLHTPNAVRRGTRKKDQTHKEQVYRQFTEWVRPLATAGHVVAALDTNNGHWQHSQPADLPHMEHQLAFLREPAIAGLREAYCDVDHPGDKKPGTWYSHFYDRVFLSSFLVATGFKVDSDPVRPLDGRKRLSDHAAIWVDLHLAAVPHRSPCQAPKALGVRLSGDGRSDS
jgi:hypothetical protein